MLLVCVLASNLNLLRSEGAGPDTPYITQRGPVLRSHRPSVDDLYQKCGGSDADRLQVIEKEIELGQQQPSAARLSHTSFMAAASL